MTAKISFPHSGFRFLNGKWTKALEAKVQTDVLPELSLLTFNVWFATEHADMRWTAILDDLARVKPHFVGLQEVTDDFLALMRRHPFVREHYCISDLDGESIRNYGTVILSHVPATFSKSPMPSYMGRDLLLASAKINNEGFVFSTTHLESLSNKILRKKQLKTIHKHLAGLRIPHAVLCGDFNFDSSTNWNPSDKSPLENDALPKLMPGFVDVWETNCPNDKGWTFDTERNLMLTGKRKEQMRYDRFLLTSRGTPPLESVEGKVTGCGQWRADRIQLVGTEPIGKESVNRCQRCQKEEGAHTCETCTRVCDTCQKRCQTDKHTIKPRVEDDEIEGLDATPDIFMSDHFGLHMQLNWQQSTVQDACLIA